MSSVLTVESLAVTYGGATALHDVSLHVEEGERVALLGANGAGKSTTLRAIGGLLRYHGGIQRAGRITLLGQEIGRRRPEQLVAAGLGQTLEGRHVFADLTVGENLRIGAFTRRVRAEEQSSRDAVFTLFPRLGERVDQPAGLLSGGEQQMLVIGRALMTRPKVLLLDEPSLGLAPLLTRAIADALVRIGSEHGVSLLIVDQSTALALRATTRAYLLENGRTTFDGPTRQLLADDRVRASYLGDTEGLTRAEVRHELEAEPA